MTTPTELEEGYYTGKLTDWKVLTQETKSGLIYKFLARCEMAGKEDGEIHNLKADILLCGSSGPNQAQIDALKESLGWSGESLIELQETDYSERTFTFKVQRKVGRDNTDYGMQVTWINRPRGYRKMSEKELGDADKGWKSLTAESAKEEPVPFQY